MSDDKVRLWRYARHGARIPEWSDVRGYEGDDGVPYIARPVADDDAREERLRDALNTNARLHRRCQKAEALPKWDDVGLARALVAMLGSLRHRYAMLRRDAAQTTARDRDHIAHIVCVLREWIRDGRPTNHTAGKEADALVDDAIATARDRDEWKARAERAEAECLEQARIVGMGGERDVALLSKLREAEAERDSARALLREARGCVSSAKINAMGYCDTEERLADLLARIDAESAERDQGAVGDQTGGGK